MRERSLGVTVLAFGSVMVGLYCQFAAIALILLGSVFTPAGSAPAAIALLVGATFLGLTVAAYFLGYGFWMRKQWSWAGGHILVAVLAMTSLALSFTATSFLSSISPVITAVLTVWLLHRPAIRAELLHETRPPVSSAPAVRNVLEAARTTR
jgi:glucan phosphoethanolaminetransferase (alkaline phosphatase superfamily)